MSPDVVAALLERAADEVVAALASTTDWGPSGLKAGQYSSDLAADAAAVGVLTGGGLRVLSEESGLTSPDKPSEIVVVVDPLDGSTNAHRGIPWYATSLCAVDADGPLVALVVDLVHGHRFRATRGGGATKDGASISPSTVTTLGDAIVGLSGLPPTHLGWQQFRSLGAAALDLCAVAEGRLDGFIDCSPSAHGSWDYLGGLLVCREAGAHIADGAGRELVSLEHADRRTPVAAGTPELMGELCSARLRWPV